MMHSLALRSLLLATVLATPLALRATPIHEDEADALDRAPVALRLEPAAAEPLTTDAMSAFAFGSTSALEEPPLALIQEAASDAGEYSAEGAQHGEGFLWVFALSGCGALGLAAFRRG